MIENAVIAQGQAESRRAMAPRRSFEVQDLLFAATTVSIISGVNLGGTRIPLFVLFVVLVGALNAKSFVTRLAPIFLVPPLVLFLAAHLISSFRVSTGNGLFLVAQAAVLIAFVWVFVVRYATRPMRHYFAATGIGLLAFLAYVIGWHISQGFYFSWKRLTDAKAVFNILPLMLVIAARSPSPLTRRLFPTLVAALIVAILISGERKAYILLLLASPLLINLRNPVTYILPFVLIVSAPVAVSLERSGYVARQIDTLQELVQGRVVKTISNEGRSTALSAAYQVFKLYPIFGVGTNAGLAYAQHTDPLMGAPHNEWVRVASENGVVGLFFYSMTVAWGIYGAMRRTVLGRERSHIEREIAFVLTAMLVLYITLEAFDFIVLLAFLIIPFVQYLRLDPQDTRAAYSEPASRPVELRHPMRLGRESRATQRGQGKPTRARLHINSNGRDRA
jgi:O-antigen ligase